MSDFFVAGLDDGSKVLRTSGYVLVAVLIFGALILASVISTRKKTISAKNLAFAATAVALAMVTSMIKLLHMPMGGSITLFSMLLVTLIGYWYGPVVGIMGGIAYGLLQFIIDPYIVSMPQVLVDYVFAFGALGLSGFFSNKRGGLMRGYVIGCFGRFVFAVLSGVIFFGQYAPETMGPLGYSIAYNGAYIGAEALATLALLMIPAVSKAMAEVKKMAVQ